MSRLLASIALVVVAASRADACSKVPGLVLDPFRYPTQAYVIGVALEDTVLAGAGKVRWKLAGGHLGPVRERSIYGQLIRVQRSGGAAASLRDSAAVLVPWDYAGDCVPVPFGRSARWLPPGTSGLFEVVLRDSVDWVRGIPTYDVHNLAGQPYQGVGRGLTPEGRPTTVAGVTPSELLDVLDRLPVDPRVLGTDMFDAMLPFLQWAKDNPAASAKYPIDGIVSSARYYAEQGALWRVQSPMFGTYRLVASITGDTARTFFMRIHEPAEREWDPDDPRGQSRYRSSPKPADWTVFPPVKGYMLWVRLRADTAPPHFADRQSYLYTPVAPAKDSAGTRVWNFEIEGSLWRQPYTDAELTRIYPGPATRARFAIDPSGKATIDYSTTLRDGRVLMMRGERISPVGIR